MTNGDDALEALVSIAAAGNATFRLADVQHRYGGAGRLLLSSGYLVAADGPRTVICRDCGEPHEGRLQYDPCAGGWRYACLHTAEWIPVDQDKAAVRFAPSALGKRLAVALSTTGRVQERVPGVFWVLGQAQAERLPWTAMLAHCGSASAVDAITPVLPVVSKVPGLVLATTTLTRHVGPIEAHRFSLVWDHLRMNGHGEIEADASSILAALGRVPRGKRPPGRPSPKAMIAVLVLALTEEEARSPATELIPLIRARLPLDAPQIKDDAMARHIRHAQAKRRKNGKS